VAEDKVQEAPEGEASEGEEGEGVQPKKKLSMKMMLIAGAGRPRGGRRLAGPRGFIFLKPKPEAARQGRREEAPRRRARKDEKGKREREGARGQVREGPERRHVSTPCPTSS